MPRHPRRGTKARPRRGRRRGAASSSGSGPESRPPGSRSRVASARRRPESATRGTNDRARGSGESAGWASSRCRTCTTSIRRRASRGRSRSACGRSTSTRSPGPRSAAAPAWRRLPAPQAVADQELAIPLATPAQGPGQARGPAADRRLQYDGRYWVVDGHNRVALALYGGQVAIDANVIELVPLGERRTEPISSLAPSVAASRAVRAAGSGQRPSLELSREDATSTAPPDAGGDG